MGLITNVPEPVPPNRAGASFTAWRRRPSSTVFAIALALAMFALVRTLYEREQRRQFAEPTTNSMGVVLSSSERVTRRRSSNELFCWVSYQFTPAGGAAQRNWRFWRPGCGVSAGRPILIQYVVGRPEVNRPAGEEVSSSAIFVWFAAGVMLVIAFVVRSARHGG